MEDIDEQTMKSIGSGSLHQQEASSEPFSSKEPKSSRLKMFAKMVKETVVVMRNVQVVNLQSIISAQQKWRTISEGYQNLLEFGAFMLLFLVVLSLEMNISDSHAVNSMLRSSLQITNSVIQDIRTQDNFWKFFDDLVGNVFQTGWYNGQIFTTEEEGALSMYSRLLGGLLIVQQRSSFQKEVCASFSSSAYSSFIGSCYVYSSPDQLDFKSLDGSVTFKYDPSNDGHSHWFTLSDGPQRSRVAAQELKAAGFLDKQSKRVSVKFGSMHSESSLFSFVRIDLTMSSAGIFSENSVDIQSVRLEPYILGSNAGDRVLLACEMIFIMWLGKFFSDFFWSIAEQTSIGGFKSAIGRWTFVDALNLVMMTVFVAFRLRFILFVSNNPLNVPTNRYPAIIEEAAALNRNQVNVSFFNIAVALLRFSKFYRFQGRLDVLNKTFIAAFENLYHYMAIFLVIFGGYAAMGHFLFGTTLDAFSTIGRSMISCLQMAVGEIAIFPDMVDAAPGIAQVFFVTFLFIVVFVLFNVLLAIIVDAYQSAANDSRETISIAQDAVLALKRLNYQISAHSGRQTVSSQRLAHTVLAMLKQGRTEVSVSDLANACGVDSVSAILNNPDVTSVKEQELSAFLDDSNSESKSNKYGSAALIL